jgi:hypothetical protein
MWEPRRLATLWPPRPVRGIVLPFNMADDRTPAMKVTLASFNVGGPKLCVVIENESKIVPVLN